MIRRFLPSPLYLRTMAAAIVAAGIVHIVMTLLAAGLNTTSVYRQITARLPVNRMVVTEPLSPATQLIPFQTPDIRMAVCRFDASNGPVTLRVSMPDASWMLSIYSPTGEVFYSMIGQEQRRSEIGLVLVPPGDRFTTGIGEAQAGVAAEVAMPVRTGLIVIRAPSNGHSFSPFVAYELAKASCTGPRA